MYWIKKVPLLLTLMRALLGPVVLFLALFFPQKLILASCLIVAFLSDVFDGIIARKLDIATQGLRRLDSIADSIFYICAASAAWILYPATIINNSTPLIILVLLEIIRYSYDYYKFHCEASYHMWSSKLWGIFLFLGFFSLFSFGQGGLLFSLAIYMGIIADIEGLLISMIIPKWKNDIPSIFHAIRERDSQA